MRTYPVVGWLVAAAFAVILNETIMMNAIPTLMAEFAVSERAAQWLSTAFMLAMAVVIPVTGWFLQQVTTRQAFATAMTVFIVGTAICAVAPAFWLLVVGRVVQACGTAVMMPLLMTTIMSVVAVEDRGRVMGNVTLAMSVAPAMGPAVSGLILESMSWRWLFGLVLPIAILLTTAGLAQLKDVGEVRRSPLDGPSVALAAVGFGGFVYGLSLIGDDHAPVNPGWVVPVGLAVLACFVWRQLRRQRIDAPLLDLRTLRYPFYAVGVAMVALSFLTMLGSMILLPLYLQNVMDLSVLQTGLLMMPGGLAMGLLGPRVGSLYDQYGARPLVVPGTIGVVVSLATLSFVSTETPIALILAVHLLMMVSLAFLFTPMFTVTLGSVPQALYSHASSLLGAVQQVAGAIGTAVSVSILASRSSSLLAEGVDLATATVSGMRWAFAACAVLALGVVAMACFVPTGRPSQTASHGPQSQSSEADAPHVP